MEPQVGAQHFLRRTLEKRGVSLNEDQLGLLTEFTRLVLSWNSKINLVSRADSENIWTSHVLHSLSLLFTIEIPGGLNILDLGSGGGFPGIPLAIVRNDLNFTLVDSIKKKTVALESIVAELALVNVSVVSARAEDLAKESARHNVVVARAVSSLTDLIKWSKPLLTRTGVSDRDIQLRETGKANAFGIPCLLAMKGGDLDGEIRTAVTKTGEKKITTLNLPLDEEVALENKKLVIVEFQS